MKNLIKPLFILCLFFFHNTSYAQHPLDFNVTVDSSCGPVITNFNVNLINPPSNLKNITIRYQGDNGMLDIQGNYTDPLVRKLTWIFLTNNGIGNFDVLVTLRDSTNIISQYVMVVNGNPILNIYCNSANPTKNDTLFFKSKFLTRPYNMVSWHELTDSGATITLSNFKEYFCLTNLENRPYKILALVEDPKGCHAQDTFNINILSTSIKSSKYNDVIVKHFYEIKSVSIENLLENNLQVYDISGRQVAQYSKQSNETYTIKDLPSGIYIARANNFRTKILIP